MDGKTQTITIRGDGEMKNYNLDNIAPWNDIEIQLLEIEEGELSIRDYVLFYLRGLWSITIPNSIKAIGTSAFEG